MTYQKSLERWIRRRLIVTGSRYYLGKDFYSRRFKKTHPQPWRYMDMVNYLFGVMEEK